MTNVKRFSPNIPIGFMRGTTIYPDPAFLLDLNTLVDRTGGVTGGDVVDANMGIQPVAVPVSAPSGISTVSVINSPSRRLPPV